MDTLFYLSDDLKAVFLYFNYKTIDNPTNEQIGEMKFKNKVVKNLATLQDIDIFVSTNILKAIGSNEIITWGELNNRIKKECLNLLN